MNTNGFPFESFVGTFPSARREPDLHHTHPIHPKNEGRVLPSGTPHTADRPDRSNGGASRTGEQRAMCAVSVPRGGRSRVPASRMILKSSPGGGGTICSLGRDR